MGAPLGNQNGAKAKIWTAAINRALDRKAKLDGKERMEILADYADKLLSACDKSEQWALKELGDRMEGRPAQTVQGPNEDGSHSLTVKLHAVD